MSDRIIQKGDYSPSHYFSPLMSQTELDALHPASDGTGLIVLLMGALGGLLVGFVAGVIFMALIS